MKTLTTMPRRIYGAFRAATRVLVSELIGRYDRQLPTPANDPTTDETRPNYAWWDRFRRGLEKGWELASPFCQPIISNIVAWTLGDLFTAVSDDDELAADANKFLADNKSLIIGWLQDALALGDGYLFINPLGDMTRLSPDTVQIKAAPSDPDDIVELTITTVSTERLTTVDLWTKETRTVTISGGENAGEPQVFTFVNTLGVIPVIHLPWARQANEIYGHPVYEQLLKVFERYHDLLSATLRGVEVMGTPIPVVNKLESIERAIAQNKTGDVTVSVENNQRVTRPQVDWEQFKGQMLWLEGDADFNFRAPSAFASDARTMLKLLFLIIVESVNIPEFVFGTAIASSRASADAQMPAFTRVIQQWRVVIEQYLLHMLEIWALNDGQFNPARLAAFAADQTGAVDRPFNIEWQPLADDSEITLQKLAHADRIGALSKAEQLRILDLVDDPIASVAEAEAEAQANRDEFERSLRDDLNEPPARDDDEEPDADANAVAA